MIMVYGLVGVVGLVLGVNFVNRYRTHQSLDQDFKKLGWDKLSRNELIKQSYAFVAQRFPRVNMCWLKYPWRNFYYRNIWKQKKGLPCHMQSFLFHRFLEKKIAAKDFKTKMTKAFNQKVWVHFYSKVKINGRWTDVDVWGKRWGIPFGRNVKNTKLVED